MQSDPLIHPIVLCGGSGTRLWPLSRKSYPKQFVPLIGPETLFQSTLKRMTGDGFAEPLVLTGDDFRFIVSEQMAAVDITPDAILIEPDSKNTAPALLVAALWVARKNSDGMLLAVPSDHVIPDDISFRKAVRAAAARAQSGDIITFGVTPTRPETGYGYLKLAEGADVMADLPQRLEAFVEKPDQTNALAMLADRRHLWNAGIFLFTARTLLDAFALHQPEILALAEEALNNTESDLNFHRLAVAPWKLLPSISIDYAIMEKVSNLAVMPWRGAWSDLGSWEAIWQEQDADSDGNVISGSTTAIDCQDCLLRSESGGVELVAIGLEDVIAIAMPDAVLVARKSDSQRVKEAVTALKNKGVRQAEAFPRDHRPWGWFDSLVIGTRFQVKRIFVHPGAALSLQSHHHRSEHWIVVQGTAKVTIADKVQIVTENQSVYIPLGALHRLENPGKVPMVLIEVQTGSYLGEDDIIRYEDAYSRS